MKIILVLMQMALMGQVLALQAVGSRVVQCDSSQLEQARRAFRANDLSLAEGLTEALMSCPGPLGEEASSFWNEIKTRRHNERLWQRAQLLIRQSELEPACQLLYEIEAGRKGAGQRDATFVGRLDDDPARKRLSRKRP